MNLRTWSWSSSHPHRYCAYVSSSPSHHFMFHPALLSAQQVELTIFEGRQDLPEDLAQTQLPSAASIGSSIHQPTRQRGTMPTMPPDIPPATPSGPVRRRSAAPMAPETPPVGFPPGAGEVGMEGNGGTCFWDVGEQTVKLRVFGASEFHQAPPPSKAAGRSVGART